MVIKASVGTQDYKKAYDVSYNIHSKYCVKVNVFVNFKM